MGYSKLFSEIVTSSIWSEDDQTRIVWITMLALKDSNGYVSAAIPGLANAARVSVEQCEAAVAKLESPDKYSRTEDHDGRRIKKVDGGWLVLNHDKYRDKRSDEERREYQRRWQAKHRQKHNVDNVDTMLTNVDTNCQQKSTVDSVDTMLTNTDTDTDTDKNKDKIASTVAKQPSKPATHIKPVNEDWLKSLKPDCVKQGINLDNELIKINRWLSAHPSKKLTQRFIINWLNRCDKTIGGSNVSNQPQHRIDKAAREYPEDNLLQQVPVLGG